MNRKMELDEIEVLLSIYKPNMEYLKKQLISLDNQTYKNISVLIRNDSPEMGIDIAFFSKYLKNVRFKILESSRCVGYIKSFEILTKESTAKIICYCDQDDIWLPSKIEKSYHFLINNNLLLVGSDLALIDKDDKLICNSLRHETFAENTNWDFSDKLIKESFFRNYVAGLTLMTYRHCAIKCIPFSCSIGHDYWLTTCISNMGRIGNLDEVLTHWRRYGTNTSGNMWNHVESKKQYRNKWVKQSRDFVEDFSKVFPDCEDLDDINQFIDARLNGNILNIWKYQYLSPTAARGEVLINLCPDFIIKLYSKYNTFQYKRKWS